ncbi:MAG: sulfatase [Nocardioides sp.]|nr:sulfatase [Nocardioides sp.]
MVLRKVVPTLSIAAVAAAGALAVPAAAPSATAVADQSQLWGSIASYADPGDATSGRGNSRRPNVLLFTTDDMSVGDIAHMPRTKRLLQRQGTTFTQAVAPSPICVPARASLLTGQYAHNHGALTISGAHGGAKSFNDRDTLPVWLKDAGYDTAILGKYLNGYEHTSPRYIAPGWTNWSVANRRVYSYGKVRYNLNGRMFAPRKAYSTDTISALTNSWLKRKARRRKPWFTWVNYVGPHHGGRKQSDDPSARWPRRKSVHLPTTTPAPRDRNRFRKLRLPDHPEMWRGSRHTAFSGPKRGHFFKTAMREVYQQRIEALQSVDRAVGRTVATLRRTGQLRNTYVIFTSDNGYLTGDHNREGKLVSYDRAVRIPLVMRGPGVPKRRRARTTVTNPDLGVTIAAIANADPGRDVDGRNVLPYLRGRAAKRVIPLEAYPVRGGARRIYQGIRYGSWTYVRTRGQEDLYNRARDHGELRDLAGLPKYKTQLNRMRRWNRIYRDCAGAECRANTR